MAAAAMHGRRRCAAAVPGPGAHHSQMGLDVRVPTCLRCYHASVVRVPTCPPLSAVCPGRYGAVWQIDNQPKKTANCMFTLEMPDGTKLYTNWLGTLKQGIKEDFPFVQITDTGVQVPVAATTANTANTTMSSNSTATSGNSTTLSVAGRRLSL